MPNFNPVPVPAALFRSFVAYMLFPTVPGVPGTAEQRSFRHCSAICSTVPKNAPRNSSKSALFRCSPLKGAFVLGTRPLGEGISPVWRNNATK